jgi:hypothetical protein
MEASFEQLKFIADEVGIGYTDLEKDALRKKLLHEGTL